MTIFDIVAEPLIVNRLTKTEREKEERVKKALQDAGLRPPEQFMWRYPHQVSGGQRQRVGIAGALVLEPSLLVADEPISMLDVSIRGDILKLMLDLREKKKLTYLFITHDLSVAYVFSDRIAVMYLGRIVEMGPTERVIKNPKHPYTQALITVVPKPDPTAKEEKIILKGERPDPTNIPKGCRFHPRCPYVMEICKFEQPEATQIEPEHWAECFLLTPDLVKKWEAERAGKRSSGEGNQTAGQAAPGIKK
jgi:oligopeptide/dipeptide ABC transporter ATP-binding protein